MATNFQSNKDLLLLTGLKDDYLNLSRKKKFILRYSETLYNNC